MNNPIRCTTHFHACDCREYEFEQLRKEIQEKDRFILSQEKYRQRTEAFWKEKLEKLQTGNAAYITQIQDKNISLVELIEPLTRKLDEKDAGVERLKREKSTAIKSLTRINKLLSNGEHLNSSWIKDIIETQSSNIDEEMRLKGVVLKLQKENQEMREALKWALSTLPHVSIDKDNYNKVIDFQNKFNLSETPNSSKEGV